MPMDEVIQDPSKASDALQMLSKCFALSILKQIL
jgi:hypothetical protein